MSFRSQVLMGWWIVSLGLLNVAPGVPASATVKAVSQSSTCPADIETLTTEMVRDLPSYANRVSQSARRLNRIVDIYTYVILAGRPEFVPLTLGPGEYLPSAPASMPQPEPRQVFITTLERQYTFGKAIELQQYHWLFLTQTTDGWQLSMMFSRTGTYPARQPLTPPQDSSDGVIAQAVRTWLRDCQAGAMHPLNHP